MQFRSKDIFYLGHGLGQDQPVLDHASGVDNAGDRAKAGFGLGAQPAHIFDVADVTGQTEHVTAGIFQTAHCGNAAGQQVAGSRVFQQLVPAGAIRQAAARSQNNTCTAVADQPFG